MIINYYLIMGTISVVNRLMKRGKPNITVRNYIFKEENKNKRFVVHHKS